MGKNIKPPESLTMFHLDEEMQKFWDKTMKEMSEKVVSDVIARMKAPAPVGSILRNITVSGVSKTTYPILAQAPRYDSKGWKKIDSDWDMAEPYVRHRRCNNKNLILLSGNRIPVPRPSITWTGHYTAYDSILPPARARRKRWERCSECSKPFSDKLLFILRMMDIHKEMSE